MITVERAVEVIKTEMKCVSSDCDRDCAKCELVMDASEILEAYSAAIRALNEIGVLDKTMSEIEAQKDSATPCIAYPGDAYYGGRIDAYNQCLFILNKHRKELPNETSD